MIDWNSPTILVGNKVKLVPLESNHTTQLLEAASDGKLWELWYTSVPSASTVNQYVGSALLQRKEKTSLPYVVIDKSDNTIIGTTRYCNIDSINHRLEIGYTWYAKKYHRTSVNTECKYLLLRHAFEQFHCIAVEFRTHWSNNRSRNAILRLGAKQDGVLRSHKLDKDGNLRDTVVFSIIQPEWQTIKKSLEYEMHKYD